jgi:hypothetical protein
MGYPQCCHQKYISFEGARNRHMISVLETFHKSGIKTHVFYEVVKGKYIIRCFDNLGKELMLNDDSPS